MDDTAISSPRPVAASSATGARAPSRRRQRGQVLAIFAAATILFVGILAIVIDVSWYWANTLRVQRAADAAALAGVVWLPGNVSTGQQAAYNEAAKDGYTTGAGGVTITANQDSSVVSGGNPNQLDVTVSASVNTFFMRLFGINTIAASRTSRALYVLPVPMGSPQNYYGDFGAVRYANGGEAVTTTLTTVKSPTVSVAGGAWTNPNRLFNGGGSTTSTTNGNKQSWSTFGFNVPAGATIDGIEADVTGHASVANCKISVALSWNGATYTAVQTTPSLTAIDAQYVLGGPADLWGHAGWSNTSFSTANFLVQFTDAGACGAHTTSADQLQVTVTYDTTTTLADSNLADPNGNALTPQGFWGTMAAEGAENVNGDIYATYYDDNGPATKNPSYNPASYYNYDVQMAAGSSNGQVWLYDAPFCAGGSNGQYGTGDRWFNGNTTGISTFYDLYDTNLTQSTGDDTLVWSSANTFKESQAWSDADMNGSGGSSCSKDTTTGSGPAGPDGLGTQCSGAATSALDCHLRWYMLPTTLAGGKIYRLHMSTTDPNNASAQLTADGHNSFAIWASATGTAPRVYGVGAMETFEPLPANQASIFYLAQISAQYAGKTMQIQLWDPGDTGALSASLKILAPTTAAYVPATFSWSSVQGTTNGGASSCNGRSGSGVTSVTSNTGNNSQFNGCWVTILIPIPSSYTAPQPVGETNGGGWWKIEYDVGNQSSSPAFDLTTWQVTLLGNPVHLVVP